MRIESNFAAAGGDRSGCVCIQLSDLRPGPLFSHLPSDLMGSQDSKQDVRSFLETTVMKSN